MFPKYIVTMLFVAVAVIAAPVDTVVDSVAITDSADAYENIDATKPTNPFAKLKGGSKLPKLGASKKGSKSGSSGGLADLIAKAKGGSTGGAAGGGLAGLLGGLSGAGALSSPAAGDSSDASG